jgi:hypothetical protein
VLLGLLDYAEVHVSAVLNTIRVFLALANKNAGIWVLLQFA